ncbi:hypothetical protein [Paenibacillus beijingensis]|uniref:Copper resistance protein D domain-containing protein n=1 Tax=Paenibacillus beijingensis TaxID=1126833 RepID=A0A0D5NLW7_9BACL|nr:hypothetical protein [Paenibacillus beijingensis]AJY76002.1 hypothetical protein VN24_17370 [Paenibacillus beijingensis]
MYKMMLFLHVLGAVGMGFYVVLPFLTARASKLAGGGQEGLAEGLLLGNRIAQYFLIVQLLTGGYLISQEEYSVAWIVIVLVLFLAIAALSGISGKPLKRIISSLRSGQSASASIARVRMFSILILVIYIVLLYLMTSPMMR